MATEDTSPPATATSEGAYARKLGLAIVSVLRDKGVFTDKDVDTILLAVNRAMQAEHSKPQSTSGEPAQEDAPTPEREVPHIDMEL